MRGLREPRAARRSSPCSTGEKNASDERRAEHRGAPLVGCAGTRRATVARMSNRPIWSAWACFDRPPLPINGCTSSPHRHGRGLTGIGWRSLEGSEPLRVLVGVQTGALVLLLRAVRRRDYCNRGPFGRRQRERSSHGVRCWQAERAVSLGPRGPQRGARCYATRRWPRWTARSCCYILRNLWSPS